MQVYDDDDDDLHEGQRSSEVKCGKLCTMVTKLGQKESMMQVCDGDDLHESQRSSDVKCGKLCTMVTKLGQNNRWCKLKMMMTFMEVKGQMGLNIVNYVPWLQTWSGHWCQLWPALRSKNQQWSNVIIYVIRLPHLIRCTATRMMMTFMKIIQRSSKVR